MPAEQRLDRNDRARLGGHQRLVDKLELAALERLAQVFLDLLGDVAVAVEIIGEPGTAVPAAFLRTKAICMLI
jgi:hypothetical protein